MMSKEQTVTVKSYEGTWRAKWTTDGAKTLEEAARKLEEVASHLRELSRDGVELTHPIVEDYGFIRTTDPEVAKKYGLYEMENDESE